MRTTERSEVNPHFHTLALDGVYVRHPDDGELVFHALAPPTAEEVAEVARRTAERVLRLLDKDDEEASAEEPSGWHICCGASAQGISLFGERAGQPPLRVVDPSQARPDEAVAIVAGVELRLQDLK